MIYFVVDKKRPWSQRLVRRSVFSKERKGTIRVAAGWQEALSKIAGADRKRYEGPERETKSGRWQQWGRKEKDGARNRHEGERGGPEQSRVKRGGVRAIS